MTSSFLTPPGELNSPSSPDHRRPENKKPGWNIGTLKPTHYPSTESTTPVHLDILKTLESRNRSPPSRILSQGL